MEKDGRTGEDRARIRALLKRSEYATLFDRAALSKEERMLEYVHATATYGGAKSVLNRMDEFGWKHWMMNVGDGAKTEALEGVLRSEKPSVVLELGGYCGYSALRMSECLPSHSRIYTIEPHPCCVAIASAIHAYAGVPSGRIQILNGTLKSMLPILRERLTLDFGPERSGENCRVDVVFLDHDKSAYLSDFLLLNNEPNNLLRKGAVVIADNVIFPGAPDYLEHIRALDCFDSRFVQGSVEYSEVRDGIEISTRIK